MEVSRHDRAQYSYHPITDKSVIRLLTLLPGGDSDDLRGSIREVSLQSAGQYEAISYAWGSSQTVLGILVDQHSLSITASAHQALIHIRNPTSARTVWIDSICINQADDAEKSIQVGIMAKIFSSAVRTLCWIGAVENGEGETVFELIRRVGNADFSRLPHDMPDHESMALLDLPSMQDPAWRAVKLFFAKPWFRRLWVVQEFVLGPPDTSILYGRAIAPWDTLIEGVVQLCRYSFLSRTGMRDGKPPRFSVIPRPSDEFLGRFALQDMMVKKLDHTPTDMDALIALFINVDQQDVHQRCSIVYGLEQKDMSAIGPLSELVATGDASSRMLLHRIGKTQERYLPLQQVIQDSVHYQVTDPRDRFYASLSLSEERDNTTVQPNYSESVEATYIRFARYLVLQSRYTASVPLMNESITGLAVGVKLPSWICDHDFPSFAKSFLLGIRSRWNAAGRTKRKFQMTDQMNELSVKAGLVDHIAEIIPQPQSVSKPGETFRKFFRKLDGMMLGQQPVSAYTNAGETLSDSLSRALIADTRTIISPSQEWWKEGYVQARQVLECSASEGTTSVDSMEGRTYFAKVWIRMWNIFRHDFSVCRTTSGLIGLVPNEVEAGQEIWIICGEATPVVLRRSQSDHSKREIVGVCYIHGVMNGEATKLDGWQEEDICLF